MAVRHNMLLRGTIYYENMLGTEPRNHGPLIRTQDLKPQLIHMEQVFFNCGPTITFCSFLSTLCVFMTTVELFIKVLFYLICIES